MGVRLLRFASWCLLGAAIGMGVALIVVSAHELAGRAISRRTARAAESTPAATPAGGEHESAKPIPPPAVPAGDASGTAASSRTGRFCLMALGTHDNYRTPGGGPYDLLIVTPEDIPARVLHKARVAHPGAKVFAYLNTMDIMLSRAIEGPRFWKEHEAWFLHDSAGNRIRVRVRHYKDALARYGMNVANPEFQAYLGDKAIHLLKAGYDGIQLDNVETSWSYRLRYLGNFVSGLPVELKEAEWYAGETALLEKVRKMTASAGFADREIIFNHMRVGEPERSMQYVAEVDGANFESWMDSSVPSTGDVGWKARVDLAHRAALEGKRTNLLAASNSLSAHEALFTFASYLMTMESDRNTFWYGKPYRVENMPWYPFYDEDIGRPAGEMKAAGGAGVFRRDFEKGVVLVNAGSDGAKVVLGKPYWDDLFEEVTSVSLAGKTGELLETPEGPPPARKVLEAEKCLGTGDASQGEAPPGLTRVDEDDFGAGAAVRLESKGAICSLPAVVAPGRYRVVVEGRGETKASDAVLVRFGGTVRRVAFDRDKRRILDLDVIRPLSSVDLKAAEPGVVVDRVTLIRLGDPGQAPR